LSIRCALAPHANPLAAIYVNKKKVPDLFSVDMVEKVPDLFLGPSPRAGFDP